MTRWITIVTSAAVILLTALLIARHRSVTSLRGDRDWCLGVMVVSVGIIISEGRTLGHPFTIVTTPFYVAFNIFILRGIARRAYASYDKEEILRQHEIMHEQLIADDAKCVSLVKKKDQTKASL